MYGVYRGAENVLLIIIVKNSRLIFLVWPSLLPELTIVPRNGPMGEEG